MSVLWEWFLSHTAFALLERMPKWIATALYPDARLVGDVRVPAFGGPDVLMSLRKFGQRKKLCWMLDIRNESRVYHRAPVVVDEVVWSIDGVLGQKRYKPPKGANTAPLEVSDLLNETELLLLKHGDRFSVTAAVSVSIHGRRLDKDASFTGKINATP